MSENRKTPDEQCKTARKPGGTAPDAPATPEPAASERARTTEEEGRTRQGGQAAVTAGRSEERSESDAGDGAVGSARLPPSEQHGPGPVGKPEQTGRQRLVAGLWPPRVNRNQLVVALLLFVLGVGLAIQVRSTSEGSALRGARQEDLVRILGELDNRAKRLEDEKQRLEDQRSELENSSDQAEEARKQTRERERQLGVLAGTVAARGPGIHLTVNDPGRAVEAHRLLDTIQELRAAGAEAIQINDVRVVADTYFSAADDGVRIDERRVTPPYRFDVIGKPQNLEPALNIPGGIVQTLRKEQATVSISRSEKIIVDALRSAKRPDYAQSSSR